MVSVPANFEDLLNEDIVASFVTILPDNTPHATPVWFDDEDSDILVIIGRDSRKHKNIERNPNVTVTVRDPANPYRYVMIRGEAIEITQDGAVDTVDDLASRYRDIEEYPYRGDGDNLLQVRIQPYDVVTDEIPVPGED